MQAATGTRKIVIDPVTRVEGHGKVTIRLNEAGGGRAGALPHRRVPRLRAVHPGADVLGGPGHRAAPLRHLPGQPPSMRSQGDGRRRRRGPVTPTAEKMRRLMHYGQVLQSNAVNFFHLASPDLLLGFESPVAKRNIIGVMESFPEVGKWAIFIRKFGQQVIAATGGTAHPSPPLRARRRQPEPVGGKPRRPAQRMSTRSSNGAATRWNCTNPSSTVTRRCTKISPPSRPAI